MKKIIVLFVSLAMLFSLTACGINLGEIADKVKQEQETVDGNHGLFGDNDVETTKPTENQTEVIEPTETQEADGSTEDGDSFFADYFGIFNIIINDEYVAIPMSIGVFKDSDNIKLLSEYPDVFEPLQMVELDAEIYKQKVKLFVYNFYHDETMQGDDAALAYCEFKVREGDRIEFYCDEDVILTQESVMKDFIAQYGKPDYKNASLTTNLVCYRMEFCDMGEEEAYLELEFDVESGHLVSFRYGLFDPGYVE